MENEVGGDWIPVLVSRDRATKILRSHVVPPKGADIDWVVKQCLRDLELLGHYGTVTLRSDQEDALVALLREIADGRPEERTILENNFVADSRANGFIERAVRGTEEMVRVIKLDLEKRIQAKIEVACHRVG